MFMVSKPASLFFEFRGETVKRSAGSGKPHMSPRVRITGMTGWDGIQYRDLKREDQPSIRLPAACRIFDDCIRSGPE